MHATESDSELLKLYDIYRSEMAKCKTGVQLENLENMWDASFRTMKTTLEEVKALKYGEWAEQVKKAFAACFASPLDQTAFQIKHTISIKSSENWVDLVVDDGQAYDDYPGLIRALPYAAVLTWMKKLPGQNWIATHRAIDLGPAEVTVYRDGRVRGCHYENGISVAGHKNWRKLCREHNHWIEHIIKR